MPSRKRGLGRGLDALIPTTLPTGAEGVLEVEVDHIAPNPLQPRYHLDEQGLEELAASIREHGVIQPLIVTQADEEVLRELRRDEPAAGTDLAEGPMYVLIAGERRWAAARLAGLRTVPVIVKEATPQEMLELALVENLQRTDLNPLEEARAYQYLVEEFGLTQEEIAARVGKHRVTVANTLRLLSLAEPVKQMLATGQLSEGHARALLVLKDKGAQTRVARMVVQRGLNVRQTEELARRVAAGDRPERAETRDPETRALEEEFRRALGTKVQLFRGRRGGRLVIYFYSEEELQGLYDLLITPRLT
jgi:ParB family chromosome partitioning protein